MGDLNLKLLLEIVRRRVWFIVIFTLIATLTSAIISFFVLTPLYEAKASILVYKQLPQSESINLEYTNILASSALIKTYQEIAKSRPILEDVKSALNLKMDVNQLEKMIDIKVLNDTQVISITVTDYDYNEAVKITNAFIDSFMKQVVSLTQANNLQILENAVNSENPLRVFPNRTMNIAISFLLGAITSSLIAFLMESLNKIIDSEEQLEELLGVPVLTSEYLGRESPIQVSMKS
ncbi:hypothetical protein BGM26_17735 [Bacillus sp. FJAT-29790]|uniref:YveK family protein n=1 Tax=Bacillus sp. FJAT-29790 TaxID=1895002 RepID=UPI001C225639|nr:Wzz/FepE/Etk N-terminal domain-containing protein [Bacillus sp. FJAT-29790]MBU8880796.1 hypothetical protein [Bacillus sp. FJAT-29790]